MASPLFADDLAETPLPDPPRPARLVALVLLMTALVLPGMWFARAAAREVSQYHSSTFEVYAREALAQQRFADALAYCEGALRSRLDRGDHLGMAYLLRAMAYDGLGDTPAALDEFHRAAVFWSDKYYFASDDDRAEIDAAATAAGLRLLEAGNAAGALDAFSSAGVGSGDVVAYLYGLVERLGPAQRTALWGEAQPFLAARRFDAATPDRFAPVADEQGRALTATGLDPTVLHGGQPSLMIEAGAAAREGRSWYGVPVYIRLGERRFGVRAVVRGEYEAPVALVLGYWFEAAQRSANTRDEAAAPGEDGWRTLGAARAFYEERLASADEDGYLVSDGIINRVSLDLSASPAGRWWLNRVEVFLP